MIKNWINAFRLRTLPLALSSIALGSFLAAANGSFQMQIGLLAVCTTVFLQVLSNLANDLGDTMNGADHEGRVGPARAVQSGVISLKAMTIAVVVFAICSFVSGLGLLYVSIGILNLKFLFFLLLGLLCIAAAIKYTAGGKPYGYSGWGDVSVFLFFGLVGVCGTYYLYAGNVHTAVLLPATTCGLFATAVLNLNNMRDVISDKLVGKNTIPVRIGLKNAKRYHTALIVLAWVVAIVYSSMAHSTLYIYLFLLLLPFSVSNMLQILKKEGAQLDPYLKKTALTTLFFVLLWGIGMNW